MPLHLERALLALALGIDVAVKVVPVTRRLRTSMQPSSMIRSPRPALRPVVSVSSTMLRIGFSPAILPRGWQARPARSFPGVRRAPSPSGTRCGARPARRSSSRTGPRASRAFCQRLRQPRALPVVQALADTLLHVLANRCRPRSGRGLFSSSSARITAMSSCVVGSFAAHRRKAPVLRRHLQNRTRLPARDSLAGTVGIDAYRPDTTPLALFDMQSVAVCVTGAQCFLGNALVAPFRQTRRTPTLRLIARTT